jgi:hypothetical protein
MAEASAEAGPSAYRWQVGDTARFWAENQGILVAWSPALPHEFCYAGGFPMQTDRIMAAQNHSEKKTRGSSQ